MGTSHEALTLYQKEDENNLFVHLLLHVQQKS